MATRRWPQWRTAAIDAAFLIGGIESGTVHQMLDLENANLVSMRRAEAYARHASYLKKLRLPEGMLKS